jgi:hypothetical protein
VHGAAIEELTAHFVGAASSSAAASEEVAQPVDEAEELDDAAEGIAELCKRVNDGGEVDSSICVLHEAHEGLHDQVGETSSRYFFST